eukprot:116131-Chlamydomonas_euryale.AAC.1
MVTVAGPAHSVCMRFESRCLVSRGSSSQPVLRAQRLSTAPKHSAPRNQACPSSPCLACTAVRPT